MLQFRIVLRETEPPIWRRIAVPADYSFWDLHIAIQDAMGWRDSHLHEFEVTDPSHGRSVLVGIPDEEFPDERPTLRGWETPVAPYLGHPGAAAIYRYDFGDGWEHAISFEGPRPVPAPGSRRPLCLGGERACPPEDVGGVPGFQEFLEAIEDPEHDEHAAMRQWAGGSYDPRRFDADKVRFDDPAKRWRMAFAR
jgi:hypothetical protein